MGITDISLQRIKRHVPKDSNLLILGCQNLYDNAHYGQLAHDYFEHKGHFVRTWDVTGCQGSEEVDLRVPQQEGPFEAILQHGTLEHLGGGIYQGFKNCHDLLEVGGVIIHENPKTGNWPGHGNYYFSEEFYLQLADLNNYEILELKEEAAMGNVTDGWNISCVLRKLSDNEFMSESNFNKLPLYDK
jgi:hypothetical protein